MSDSVNYEAVCRTAPATPGLSMTQLLLRIIFFSENGTDVTQIYAFFKELTQESLRSLPILKKCLSGKE